MVPVADVRHNGPGCMWEIALPPTRIPTVKLETLQTLPELLTVEQVASIFQVRDTTVRLWLKRSLMRGVKVGRSWRVSKLDVEQFAKEPYREEETTGIDETSNQN